MREETKKSLQKSSQEAIGKQRDFNYLYPNSLRNVEDVDCDRKERKNKRKKKSPLNLNHS